MTERLPCTVPTTTELAEALYCVYNAGGDPMTAGLNYRGDPCPAWGDLPENVREKWRAAAALYNPPGSFGWALEMAKRGHKIQRAGWNGKGMWVALSPGIRFAPDAARDGSALHLAKEMQRTPPAADYFDIVTTPRLDMRAADGSLVIGWLASQTDMLAEDWRDLGA